jgi:nucleoside-diphosphate-sugar epimerase
VIHLAGRATFERYDRIAPSIVDGSDAMARSAVREGVDRFVFGSSLFVHGPDDGPVVDASSTTSPILDYGRAKLEAERAVAGQTFDRGALSVRLPHVYGPMDLLFGFLRRGVLPFPADLEGVFPHQHVSDAARFLIAATDIDASGAVPVADDLPVSWRHFFDVVRLYLPSARIVRLPSRLSQVGAAALEQVVPSRYATMATVDTIRGWNLQMRTKPGTMTLAGVEPLHPTVDSGIPAVFDSAVPYRWRHPVLDHRRP